MAQKVQILLEDDFSGGTATQTITFAIDGVTYEIDLNDDNAAKLRDDFGSWVGHARKASRATTAAAARRRPAPNRRQGVQDEREWLITNGYQVSSRGRIPGNLREIYNAAH